MRPTMLRTVALTLLSGFLLLACSTPAVVPLDAWFSLPYPRSLGDSVMGSWDVEPDARGSFLRYNASDGDGTPGYIHVTESDMPLVVSLGYPREPPKYGSRKHTRATVIEALRQWESAIQRSWPQFQLTFVEDDPMAPVQVYWERQLRGNALGRGWMRARVADGELRVGGELWLTTRIDDFRLAKIDEVKLVAAHEFGHVLGLFHCLGCNAAMNYEFETRKESFVTVMDVMTFLDLRAQPNGLRTDGEPLRALVDRGWNP